MKKSSSMCSPGLATVRWAIAALTALAVAPAAARADEPAPVSVAIEWTQGDACIDGPALAVDVARKVRKNRIADGSAEVRIRGRASETASRAWRVTLVVLDARGEELGRRELELTDADCAALREHVVLVVAMLVDSSLVEAASSVAPSTDEQQVKIVADSETDVPTGLLAPAPSSPPRRIRVDVAAAVLAEVGRLPGTPVGLGLVVGIASPAGFRLELGAAGYARATAASSGGETLLRWRALSLSACAPGVRRVAMSVTACAGAELGRIAAEGRGFLRNHDPSELTFDALAEARLELAVTGRWFARLALVGRAALHRPRFGYEDENGAFIATYSSRPVAASGQIAIGARFP